MLHPVTKTLIEAYAYDIWPTMAAIVDFGITDQEHYEAFYYPVRRGEVTPEQLDDAMMAGSAALTALAQSLSSNPHKDIVFKTAYDNMPSVEEDEDDIEASREAMSEGEARPYEEFRKELGLENEQS